MLPRTRPLAHPRSFVGLLVILLSVPGCKKDEPSERAAPPTVVPPPRASASSASGDVCSAGGGQVNDPTTATFIPRRAAGYCIDPAGETRTYGEKGKFSMDEVCTTAFDGECEVYKRYQLKRLTTFRFVDGAGKGSSVEVKLSEFASPGGAYGMFTKRVVAEQDPAQPKFPRPVEVVGAAALGSGVSYLWKGAYLAELTYLNEEETPDAFTKSADIVLPDLMKEMGKLLPAPVGFPASTLALPNEKRLSNGVQFFPKGLPSLAPSALSVGYYRDGTKRYRGVSLSGATADEAKATFKSLRGKAGAAPIAEVGEEALLLVVQEAQGRPKSEYLFARKGAQVFGVGDEELVLDAKAPLEKQEALRLSKAEKSALLGEWLKLAK